jgi:hypothetical protein
MCSATLLLVCLTIVVSTHRIQQVAADKPPDFKNMRKFTYSRPTLVEQPSADESLMSAAELRLQLRSCQDELYDTKSWLQQLKQNDKRDCGSSTALHTASGHEQTSDDASRDQRRPTELLHETVCTTNYKKSADRLLKRWKSQISKLIDSRPDPLIAPQALHFPLNSFLLSIDSKVLDDSDACLL